jgi:L-seryl-tRNA(Ser) seleniumtransferase
MVVYSGGKAIRGPQGTGVLCGRADLIAAAAANASPNQFIGRGMKVAKEEIVGLIHALQMFVEEDEEAENRRYHQMCRRAADALAEVPGIEVSVVQDSYDFLIPHALIHFTGEEAAARHDQVYNDLIGGDPSIYLHNLGNPDDLAVDPINLDDDELEIVIRRVREAILAGG